jgi:capsule polysaccharide export protein KpsE/RkpR
VAETVIDRFHLDRLWQSQNREQALKTFGQRLTVQLSREEFLSVSFEAESPQLSADVTNAIVEEMDRAYRRSKSGHASQVRQQLEKELARAQEDMERVELAYNAFQQAHLAVNLEEQTKAAIEGASHLIDQIAELKVKIQAGRQVMTDSNEHMVRLRAELQESEKLLNQMVGSPDGAVQEDGGGPQVYIPFKKVPDLGMDLLRRTRDLKIQEAVYAFLRQKYEEAKYEEAKATPTIQVLDRAVPPLFRSRPQRTLMVAGAGAASLLIAAFLAFLFEAFREMPPEEREKLSGLWRGLKR